MEIHDIVKTWLQENGYNGLCDPEIECGCAIDDFMPCGEPGHRCEAGHTEEAPPGSGVDYFIYPGKG